MKTITTIYNNLQQILLQLIATGTLPIELYTLDDNKIEDQNSNALLTGQIGILNDLNAISNLFNQFCELTNEREIKKLSAELQQLVTDYNKNLEKLALVFNREAVLDLKINNIFLPLPKDFDVRSLHIASNLPNHEGLYRRSQIAHLYNATDSDGVEFIPLKVFNSRNPAKGEVLVCNPNADTWQMKFLTNSGLSEHTFDNMPPVSTFLQKRKSFTYLESLSFLKWLNALSEEKFSLKRQFNQFGERIVETLSANGHPYNVGAIASRIDQIIQYERNHKISKVNNKKIIALKDKILEHKNKKVAELVNRLSNEKLVTFEVDAHQLKANYP